MPDPDRIKPTYEALLANDPATPFPFWARIWPSAIAMAAFLEQNPSWIHHKKVLEIGAGVGLPSFSIAHQTRETIISDHAPEAVALAESNIHRLQLQNVRAIWLDWNNLPQDLAAETILLSDVNYAPDQFDSLQTMIRHFTTAGSTVILSTPQRITSGRFMEMLVLYMQTSTVMTIHHDGSTADISISILSL